MHTKIEVKDRAEAELLQRALADPEVRAFVIIVGALLPFSKTAQKRMLDFVAGHLKEHEDY